MRWGKHGIVDELRAARKELREVKAERDALAERLDWCGQLLGTIICAGSLAPGESLIDPPKHAAVDAILRVVAERDYHRETLRRVSLRVAALKGVEGLGHPESERILCRRENG